MLRSVSAYTLSHFAVDYACFAVLFGFLPQEAQSVAFLAYNIVAFGLQAPLGAVLDVLRLPGKFVAMAALGLLLIGLALSPALPWAGMFVCALANALFHVSAGRDVLLLSRGKMGANGVFVASGAPGVALGTLWGRAAFVPALLLCVLCFGLCGFAVRPPEAYTPAKRLISGNAVFFGAVLCFVCIFVRSLGGGLFVKPALPLSGLLLALLAGGGKTLGGVLADRFGARLVACISLALAALCLFVAPPHTVSTLLGAFCFNIPMPVTLVAMADRLGDRPGLAFGLTTLALLLGAVPFFFGLGAQSALGFIVSLVAIAFLWMLLPKEVSRHDKTVCRRRISHAG